MTMKKHDHLKSTADKTIVDEDYKPKRVLGLSLLSVSCVVCVVVCFKLGVVGDGPMLWNVREFMITSRVTNSGRES